MAEPAQLDALLDEQLEEHLPLVRAVAFRLLGSLVASDAAAQAALGRSTRVGSETDLHSWLVSTTGAICLQALRSRTTSPWHVPDFFVSGTSEHRPDELTLLGDAVGVPPFVALDDLTPEQRVAFVLHDDFGVPVEEISTILGCSTGETEQLVGAGRHRLSSCPVPDTDLAGQHKVVGAYLRAIKRGNLDAAVGLLHDDIRIRSDAGEHVLSVAIDSDVPTVAGRAIMLARVRSRIVPVVVNRAAGFLVVLPRGVLSVVAMTVVGGRIAEIDTLHEPQRIAGLNLPAL